MNITKRLNNVMREGNLTLSDMARWLDRPFATIRGWKRGRGMNGGTQDQEVIIERLKLIEKRIRLRRGLPVPQFEQQGKIRVPTLRIIYLNKLMARKKM